MRIAFDIGGVISKFPNEFADMMAAFWRAEHLIYILTDMHDRDEVERMLKDNGVMRHIRSPGHILIADYATHGEAAKAVILRDKGIDVFVDDFPGYLVWPWPTPAPLRLQVMPDPRRPYWHPGWACNGGEFGRRVFTSDTPPTETPAP